MHKNVSLFVCPLFIIAVLSGCTAAKKSESRLEKDSAIMFLSGDVTQAQMGLWATECRKPLLNHDPFIWDWYKVSNSREAARSLTATKAIDPQRAQSLAKRHVDKVLTDFTALSGYDPSKPITVLRRVKIGSFNQKTGLLEFKVVNSRSKSHFGRLDWPVVATGMKSSNSQQSLLGGLIDNAISEATFDLDDLGSSLFSWVVGEDFGGYDYLLYEVVPDGSVIAKSKKRGWNQPEQFYIKVSKQAAYILVLEQTKGALHFQFTLEPKGCAFNRDYPQKTRISLNPVKVEIFKGENSPENLIYSS